MSEKSELNEEMANEKDEKRERGAPEEGAGELEKDENEASRKKDESPEENAAEGQTAVRKETAVGEPPMPGKKVTKRGRVIAAVATAIAAATVIIAAVVTQKSGVEGESEIYRAARDTSTKIESIIIGVEGLEGGYRPREVTLPGDRLASDAMYEALVAMGKDGRPENVLAESVEISEDGLTYSVKVKKGVRFHNGEELTARDALASAEAMVGSGARTESYIAGIAGYEAYANGEAATIEGIKVTAEDELTFTFTEVRADNIWALGAGVQREEEIWDYSVVNGTGPYKYGTYVADKRILTLTPNEEYREGGPKEGITLKDIPIAQAARLYREGEINAFQFNYDEGLLAELEEIGDMNIYQGGGGSFVYLGINCERYSVELRRALSRAIDREAFAEEVYGDGAKGERLPIPEGSYARGGIKSGKEKEDEKSVIEGFKQAGYEKNAAGEMTGADGKRLVVKITSLDTELARRELNAISGQLGKYGVQTEQEILTYKEYRARVNRDGEYEVYLSTWQSGMYVDVSRFARGSGANVEKWHNEKAEAAIEGIRSAKEYGETVGKYKEFLNAYEEDAPQIPLATAKRFAAAHHSIEGIKFWRYTTVYGDLSGIGIK